MITDHRYDAGWPRDDSENCIAIDAKGLTCRAKEVAHTHSEYPSQRPNREDPPDGNCLTMPNGECVTRRPCMHTPGDMHEPDGYPFELDWHESTFHLDA